MLVNKACIQDPVESFQVSGRGVATPGTMIILKGRDETQKLRHRAIEGHTLYPYHYPRLFLLCGICTS